MFGRKRLGLVGTFGPRRRGEGNTSRGGSSGTGRPRASGNRTHRSVRRRASGRETRRGEARRTGRSRSARANLLRGTRAASCLGPRTERRLVVVPTPLTDPGGLGPLNIATSRPPPALGEPLSQLERDDRSEAVAGEPPRAPAGAPAASPTGSATPSPRRSSASAPPYRPSTAARRTAGRPRGGVRAAPGGESSRPRRGRRRSAAATRAAGSVRATSSASRIATLEQSRERLDRRGAEDRAERQVVAELPLDRREQGRCDDRRHAEIEEVVGHPDRLIPSTGSQIVARRRSSSVRGATSSCSPDRSRVGSGSALRSTLPFGVRGNDSSEVTVEWHHVRR